MPPDGYARPGSSNPVVFTGCAPYWRQPITITSLGEMAQPTYGTHRVKNPGLEDGVWITDGKNGFEIPCTVPVPIPSDLATFKIPTPFASCFRTSVRSPDAPTNKSRRDLFNLRSCRRGCHRARSPRPEGRR